MSFYEVYTHVSEMHLSEIGLKTTWHEVDMNSTDKGQATWEGIIRRVRRLLLLSQCPVSLVLRHATDSIPSTVLEHTLPLSTARLPTRFLAQTKWHSSPSTAIATSAVN